MERSDDSTQGTDISPKEATNTQCLLETGKVRPSGQGREPSARELKTAQNPCEPGIMGTSHEGREALLRGDKNAPQRPSGYGRVGTSDLGRGALLRGDKNVPQRASGSGDVGTSDKGREGWLMGDKNAPQRPSGSGRVGTSDLGRGASPRRVKETPQRPLGSGKVGAKQLRRTDRTLCFFIMALQGHEVVIELRSSTFLKGTIYMADVHWNIFLSKATFIKEGASTKSIDWIFVKASTIRMIHLDKDMNFRDFVVGERAQVAAMHAQRKVAMLSNTQATIETPSDKGRPDSF